MQIRKKFLKKRILSFIRPMSSTNWNIHNPVRVKYQA